MLNANDEKNSLMNTLDYITKISSLITIIGLIMTGIMRFIEFIKCNIYFKLYGIDSSLYVYNNQNFFYSMVLSFILLLSFYSTIYSFKRITKNILYFDILNRKNVYDFILICVSNITYIFYFEPATDMAIFTAYFVCLIFVEFITMLIFSSFDNMMDKTINVYSLNDIYNYLINISKLIPVVFIILTINKCIFYKNSVINEDEYYMIGNNMVVVYTSQDYYVALDCEYNKKKDSLTIYIGSQTKLDNNNVKTQLKKFKNVKVVMYNNSDIK